MSSDGSDDLPELPPVSLAELASASGKSRKTFHGRTRRKNMGLIDVGPPTGGGDMGWVTGVTAAAYIANVRMVREARRLSKK